MSPSSRPTAALAACAALFVLTGPTNSAHGQFVLVEDFDSIPPGGIAGERSWSSGADPHFEVDVDPTDAGNQVLSVLANGGSTVVDAYNDDPNISIGEGETGALFFRFLLGSANPHVNFGLSDLAAPGGDFNHFEAQVRSMDSAFDARDGAAFTALGTLSQGVWYSVWMILRQGSDSWDAWIQGGSEFPAQTQLDSGIQFRNGTSEPLRTFFLRNSDGHGGSWYLDDIYVDQSQPNLQNPVTGGPPPPPPPPPEDTIGIGDLVQLPSTSGSNPITRINAIREAPDGSGRLFVNDLRGPLWVVEGETIQEYVDLRDVFPRIKLSPGLASGFVSFAFHPEFASNGLFYTVHSENASGSPAPNIEPAIPTTILQHSVLTEWEAGNPAANAWSGTRRELMRVAAPHQFHNFQEIAFNPNAGPADPDYGLLYIGSGDFGVSAKSPREPAQLQRLDTVYGCLLRIDPDPSGGLAVPRAGSYGYSIPPDNPFVDGDPDTFDEIYASGFRNGHRLVWDPAGNQNLFVTDIGEANREEINLVVPGGNYGWPNREGDQVVPDPGGDPGTVRDPTPGELEDDLTFGYRYPVAQYPHGATQRAIAGGFAYRGNLLPELKGRLVFGDIVSGRIWYASIPVLEAADDGDRSTMAAITELELEHGGLIKSLLQIVRDAAGDQGLGRTDLRFGTDLAGEPLVTTKDDGFVRTLFTLQPAAVPSLTGAARLLLPLALVALGVALRARRVAPRPARRWPAPR